MTIAAYENYLSQKEWECFLRGMVREYAHSHPMSISERDHLMRWLMTGHGIHENPNGLSSPSGEPVDYLYFLRSSGRE